MALSDSNQEPIQSSNFYVLYNYIGRHLIEVTKDTFKVRGFIITCPDRRDQQLRN